MTGLSGGASGSGGSWVRVAKEQQGVGGHSMQEDSGRQQREATANADPSAPSRCGAMRLRMTGLLGGANESGGSWVCFAKERQG